MITLVIPYNPLLELSGLQNLAKRWGTALVGRGHPAQIYTVGRSGTHGDVAVVGFPGIVPLCLALVRDGSLLHVHWMEVWPTRTGAYLQCATALLAKLLGRTHTLTTETPGNLGTRGALRGVGRHLHRLFAGFVVSNPDFVAEYRECGVPPSAVTVVPHGLLASEPFQPLGDGERSAALRRLGLDPHRPCVLYLGRMVVRKRPHDFIAAARLALESGCHAQFVLVGESWHHEDSIDASVHDAVAALGSPHVTIHSHTSRPWEYLGVADLVVLTSERDGEAFVVLEALACGATVLVPDVPVLRNFGAPPPVPLHVFPLGDVAALASAISTLLNAPATARPDDAGPAFVGQARRLERLIQRYLDAYCPSLAPGGRPA